MGGIQDPRAQQIYQLLSGQGMRQQGRMVLPQGAQRLNGGWGTETPNDPRVRMDPRSRQEPQGMDPMAFLQAVYGRSSAKPGKGLISTT